MSENTGTQSRTNETLIGVNVQLNRLAASYAFDYPARFFIIEISSDVALFLHNIST